MSIDTPDTSDNLYFRQLLSGRDFAQNDPVAKQMVNFCYLVGDRETGETVIIDPAYNVADLVAVAAEDDMQIVGSLATHYHADHMGGNVFGQHLEGVNELLDIVDVPVHIQADEADYVHKTTGLTDTQVVLHNGAATVSVGGVDIEIIHTPGHTPGSQSFLVRNRLLSGDTLFLEGCGRTDLPGGDPAELYETLTKRLARIPDDAILYPGHLYAPEPSATMGETRKYNYVFAPKSADQWLAMFGR